MPLVISLLEIIQIFVNCGWSNTMGVDYSLPDFKMFTKLQFICDDHLKIRATFITTGKKKGSTMSKMFSW